jgi:hypothetical protein
MKPFRYALAGLLAAVTMVAFADEAPEEEAAPPPPPAPAEEAAPAPAPEPAPAVEEAPAAEAPAEPGRKFYAGGGLALIQADVDTIGGGGQSTVTGANLRMGYMLFDWLAIEAQVLQGFTTPDLNKVVGSEVDLGTSWGVFVKPNHTFGPINLFATLGYMDTDLNVDGPGGSVDVGDDNFAYGLGTRIPTSKGAFDFEYLRLLDKGGVTAQGLEFSYSYFFF